jgi:hypothetical protein
MVGLFLSPNFTVVVTAVVTATGPWMLEVKQAGRYPATLRQYPQEANKPVIAVRAKIEMAARSMSCSSNQKVGEKFLKWISLPGQLN